MNSGSSTPNTDLEWVSIINTEEIRGKSELSFNEVELNGILKVKKYVEAKLNTIFPKM